MKDGIEPVGGDVQVCTSERHTFGTDAFLLSDFAQYGGGRQLLHPGDTACDLGCGCGVVPLLWFRDGAAPGAAWAVDIQPEAVALVRRGVSLSGLEHKLHPLQADLRELRRLSPLPPGFRIGGFDLITCNPPYNAQGTGIQSDGDSERIARHETLCTLDDVCAAAESLLRYGGRLCLCQLPERLVDVLAAMRAHRIEPKRLRMVQQTAASAPWLILVEGRRGGKPHLRMEPPLIMREGGGPTLEMQRIYRTYGKV